MSNYVVLSFVCLLWLGCAPACQAQSGPQRWQQEISRLTQADAVTPLPVNAVVFAGSSSIRLWPNLAQHFPQLAVIQRGFGGSHLADVSFYADRIITPYHPRTVVVYAGDNDLAAGKTAQEVADDYRELVGIIRRQLPAVRIGFIAIKPSPSRWHLAAQQRAANALVAEWSATDSKLFFVDVFTPMLGDDGSPRRELFLADGLHLNAAGYALWKKTLAPYLVD